LIAESLDVIERVKNNNFIKSKGSLYSSEEGSSGWFFRAAFYKYMIKSSMKIQATYHHTLISANQAHHLISLGQNDINLGNMAPVS